MNASLQESIAEFRDANMELQISFDAKDFESLPEDELLTLQKQYLEKASAVVGAERDFFQSGGMFTEEAFAVRTSVWLSPVIPVHWENPTPDNADERRWIQEAIERTWESESLVDFVGWDAATDSSGGIRILLDEDHPHCKRLGRFLDGVEDGMVLNIDFDEWCGACRVNRKASIEYIAIHEFGHALGFAHEQNRSDAPGRCQELRQGSMGDWRVTQYDPDSIMNYCNDDWNNNGQLSDMDIEAVRILYGSPEDRSFYRSEEEDSDDEQGVDLGELLVKALLQGGAVDAARAKVSYGSGRSRIAIFGWFENREAVLNWYYGQAHRATIKKVVYGDRVDHTMSPPLSHLDPAYSGPVLVAASMTDYQNPDLAIELFQPIPAGLGLEGRFSPPQEKFFVPHYNDRPSRGWVAESRLGTGVSISGMVRTGGPDSVVAMKQSADDPARPEVMRIDVDFSPPNNPALKGPTWIAAETHITLDPTKAYTHVEINIKDKPPLVLPIQ